MEIGVGYFTDSVYCISVYVRIFYERCKPIQKPFCS